MVNGVDECIAKPSHEDVHHIIRLGRVVVDDEEKLIFPQNANFRAKFRYDALFNRLIRL
jgi:hypothetical protein